MIDSLTAAGGDSSRVVFTPGNQWSVRFIERSFLRIGLVPHADTAFRRRPAVIENVTALLPGTSDSLVIFDAHLDASASSDRGWRRRWKSARAPGAVDDASGIAVMLQLARIATRGHANHYSILFVASNGEERNPHYSSLGISVRHHVGSRHLAKLLADSAAPVASVIVLDMVGSRTGDSTQMRVFSRPSAKRVLRALLDADSATGGPPTLEPVGACPYSDNEAYERYGFPTLLLMQSCRPWKRSGNVPAYADYHSARDLPRNVDLHRATMITLLLSRWLNAQLVAAR